MDAFLERQDVAKPLKSILSLLQQITRAFFNLKVMFLFFIKMNL